MHRILFAVVAALALVTAASGTRASAAADGAAEVVQPWNCLTAASGGGQLLPDTPAPGCVRPSVEWSSIARDARIATAIVPPSPPFGLTATVIGTNVVLRWTPANVGGTPTSYVIQAGSSPGAADVVNANTGSALPTLTASAVPGGKYFFRVLARNASGTSAASNDTAVVIAADCSTPSSAPTSLSASVNGSDVSLRWSAPAGGCAPTSYVIQAGSSPGLSNLANFSTGNAATTFGASGVATGVYYVRVIAVDAGGRSAPSNEVQVAVNTCVTAPGPTTGLNFTAIGSTVTLAWNAANGSPTGYIVSAGSSSGASNLATARTSGPSFAATGVPAGTYFVRVVATNSCGSGAASNEVVIPVGAPLPPTNFSLTAVHGFAGAPSDGSNLSTLVLGRDGNFYGTTVTGGPFNPVCVNNLDGCGTAFKLTPNGTFSIIHTFANDGPAPHPIYPYGTLLEGNDGNFYGTLTEGTPLQGRLAGGSAVFRMTPSGSVTVMAPMGGPTYSTMIQGTDGNFYGTSANGTTGPDTQGFSGPGAVWRMSPNGALTYLHVFTGGSDGMNPFAGLLQGPDGNFYGTTMNGGASGNGTIYKITPGGVLTTLHTFTGGADGGHPSFATLMIASDGNFYGTAQFGGGPADGGTLFRMTPSGAFTVLHAFTGIPLPDGSLPTRVTQDGAQPVGNVVELPNGNLLGTTAGAGAWNGGTAYVITKSGAYTQLFTFAGNDEGSSPTSTLVKGNDGFYYGTAQYGGRFNKGAIFRVTPP